MGVPVLAYAATAVPATMDGGGVLYHRKDPLEIAALVNAVAGDAALRERVVASQDAALARLLARDFGGMLLGFVERALAAPRPHPPVASDFWDQVRQAEELEELRMYRPAAYRGAAQRAGTRGSGRARRARERRRSRTDRARDPDPGRARPEAARVIVNQWVPAAHRGDAIGDSARRVRGLLRGMGHQSDLYALTIDDDLAGDVRPFADAGARGWRPDHLPLRPAVADDRGVRPAAARAHPAVPQRDAGALLRALRRRHLPAGHARPRRAGDAGRAHRHGPGRLGLQPGGARRPRLRQHRRLSHRHRRRANHRARRGARRSSGCSTTAR